MKYAFIGLGNMAGAILRGMQASGRFESDMIFGYDTNQGLAQSLQEAIGLAPVSSPLEAVQMADTIVLCVKPQVMPVVLDEIAGQVRPDHLIITIAAGLPLSFYEGRLPKGTALVRTMPSINAQALCAASAACANAAAGQRGLDAAKKLLGAVGAVHEVEEKHIPAFSAIAGAAPAFAFQFADALAQAGIRAGLSASLSRQVAAELLYGSGKLLLESAEHPRQLMDKVTSPGGTTIEGVLALDAQGFSHALHEAVQAVIAKDISLGKEK